MVNGEVLLRVLQPDHAAGVRFQRAAAVLQALRCEVCHDALGFQL